MAAHHHRRLKVLSAQVAIGAGQRRLSPSISTHGGATTADLVIRSARIIDGTGQRAAFVGDVAIKDGVIIQVGGAWPVDSAVEDLDAQGNVLAPGFIDIHTHFDPQICWDGRADPSLLHGVTTVVVGNCGLSLSPCADRHAADRIVGMFGRVEDIRRETFEVAVPFEKWFGRQGSFASFLQHIQPTLNINVAALVGHSAIRLAVMGRASQEREATQQEINAMAALVQDAMAAGAAGVSSSQADRDELGVLVPSAWSSVDERAQLAAAMSRRGLGQENTQRKGVWQEVPELVNVERQIQSIRELGQVSKYAGVMCSFQPLLTLPSDPARSDILGLLEELHASGSRVMAQATPRDFNMSCRLRETSMLLMGIPSWNDTMKITDDEQKLAKFSDPVHQQLLIDDMEKSLRTGSGSRDALGRDGRGAPQSTGIRTSDEDADGSGNTEGGDIHLASCIVGASSLSHPENQKYAGRELREIARTEGKKLGRVVLDISLREGLNAEFRLEGRMNSDKSAVATMLSHPLVQLGASDAGAHVTQFCGTGDTTFFLQRYVNEDQRFSLEAAIHQLTGALSESWGLRNRGLLVVGRAADLVLLDLGRLRNGEQEFVADVPGGARRFTRHAHGFQKVWVNGALVVENDAYTRPNPGCGQLV